MLDPSRALPLYQQLKQALRRSVEAETWAVDQAIPPERELMEHYGVSRITVRQALADLVAEGLLYRRQGKGTYVAPRRPGPFTARLASLLGHMEELQLRGLNPEVDLLHLDRRPAPTEIANALEREVGSPMWQISRRIRLDSQPLMVIHAWVPADLTVQFGESELTRTSIAGLLESFGQVPVRGEQRIKARLLGPDDAALLAVREGSPALEVQRRILGRDDRPLERSLALFRADLYEYHLELRR